ncbi:MAG: hydroxylamine reductase [Candidatus Gastranaerophilales bacterium]|nr:hydroxylamine reductase [Candidatus Gastranaerophilales bacterium]
MSMFCFQCEQTARGQGCTQMGVCGKKADTANLQDELTSKLIELANVNEPSEYNTKLIIDGLFTTITNVNFDDESIKKLTDEISGLIKQPSPFDINSVWGCDEDIRSLKSLILFGLKGIAAYAHHAWVLGYKDAEVNNFFYEALQTISKDLSIAELLPAVLKTGEINLKCMELLDKANTESYGNPTPTQVTTNIEKGPFIIVTGHDLKDLGTLLEQTKDKGINIYTHGEMLPCHAYPELKKYPHLKGNFGTAWQNQQKEFDNVPAAILFTTNCIMPVKDSYKDRVFTTSVVEYPELVHIDENKDFTPVIEKALELGGYNEEQKMTGINGGDVLTTGFGHNAVLSVADKVVGAVKEGKIKHIFLVGGCDGAKPGRNYYTDFVKQTPNDTLILTLACGKFRFNDLDLGTIDGIPRILDMGQCNDAYSAIKVAVALAEVFKCSVNDLPLSMVLSWYEQKAVCILLTLLYLGIENIRLGPTLPAFVSPNVLNVLVDKYKIKPITTPEEDLKAILG